MTLLFLLWICLLQADPHSHLLYLIKSKQIDSAIDTYKKYLSETEGQDFEFLHELAWSLIEEGTASEDPETNLMALFGASLSTQEKALPYFIKAFHSKNPSLQIAALNFLANMNHDQANKELLTGLSSNEILIRFMTLHLMAEKKMQGASLQVEALMSKLPKEIHPLFPPLFAQIGDSLSMKQLRRCLSDPDDRVRASALLSIQLTQHEEFLPQVRRAAKHINPLLQETAAACLGAFKDEKSADLLKKLCRSQVKEVRTTAIKALIQMDNPDAKELMFEEAKGGNIYALHELGSLFGYEEFLLQHLSHPEKNVRINAAMALLEKKDPRCLKILEEYLVNDKNNQLLTPTFTPSKSSLFWKLVPCNVEEEENKQAKIEKILQIKELLIGKIFDLPERYYLQLTEKLLQTQQNPLLPTLILFLEKSGSEETIPILKKYQQHIGSPFVRMICTLSLYRLGVAGPYKERLRAFVKDWKGNELIQFRPLIQEGWENYPGTELTPNEISRLLIETLEALVEMQDEETIDILLQAIQKGNPKNKYALAGILVRATL